MKKIVDHLSGRQLHLALLFIPVVLFLFKLLLLNHTGWAAIIIGEILILGTVVLYMLYGIMFIRRRYVETPIALVKKLGSTGFIIFTLGIIFGAVWPNTTASEYGFLLRLAAIIVSLLTASLVAFLLAGFRELSFLGQKQSPEKFFNVILGFMVLVFFLTEGKPNGVGSVFYAVAFILFFIHSIIRVAWIAFLTKKEKYQLLGITAFYIFVFTCIGVFSFFQKPGPGETTQLLSFFQVLSNVSPGLVVLVRLMAICWSVYLSVVFFITLFHLPTAEVMDRKAVEATSIKGLNKLMTRVFDFKELADTVTAITAEVCHSDSAWLVTKTESGFTVNATENIDAEEAREISTVLLKDQRLFIDRVTTLNTGTIKSRLKGTGVSKEIKTLTVAPLLVRESISGYLFASCSQALGFDKGDEGAIAAFADHAALALDNARLLETRLAIERMEKELDMAREVQEKLLPYQPPLYETLSIAAHFSPAHEVGGDYYDFFDLKEGRMGFVAADVSGKGISAAFIMAEVKGIFESLAKVIDSPKKLLQRANEILSCSIEKNRFVTAMYGIVNVDTGALSFARCGHNPLILYSKGKIQRLMPKGMALGMVKGETFSNKLEEMELQLSPGDIVTLSTDGVNEAQNALAEDFGFQRMEKVLTENPDKTPGELTEELIGAVTAFSHGQPRHDDITLVIFKWLGPKILPAGSNLQLAGPA